MPSAGSSVFGYHLFNLAVHLADGAHAVFGLLRRIGPKDGPIARGSPWSGPCIRADRSGDLHGPASGVFDGPVLLADAIRAGARVGAVGLRRSGSGFPRAQLSRLAGWAGDQGDMVSAPLMALLLDRTFLAGSFSAACVAAALLRRARALLGAAGVSDLSTGGNRGGSVGFNLRQIEVYEYWLTHFPRVHILSAARCSGASADLRIRHILDSPLAGIRVAGGGGHRPGRRDRLGALAPAGLGAWPGRSSLRCWLPPVWLRAPPK